MVAFRMVVLPMGWKWSVYCMQAAQERLLEKTGKPVDALPWVLPNCTPGHVDDKGGFKSLYIDNYAVFSTSEAVASTGVDDMATALRSRGLACTLDDASSSVYLGFELLGGARWQPTRKKFWRFERALRYLKSTSDPI